MDVAPVLSFGSMLRRHRVAAGLSQDELAERAAVSRRSISDMERGVPRRPHPETITLLAEALALSGAERTAFVEAARRLRTPPTAAAPPAARPARGAASPFVGRTRELALLERHLAGEGAPLLLLAGEPGIGKTRLLHAAQPRAMARGLCVLDGGCQRRGGQEPYAPLLGALQRFMQHQGPGDQRAALRGCAWLVKLLPELAGGPIEPLPPWTLPPEQERRLTQEAVMRFLANIAGRGGTVLLLDDLQWAGPDALDLLAMLVRAAATVPLRLIGTYRDTEVQPSDALAVLLADLLHAGLARRRLLGPLTAPEAAQLLDELWDAGGGGEPTLRAQMLQRAGGVPFFLVSCALALQQEEGEAGAAGVPWDVAHTVRQRVAALPDEARAVLGVAAVVGRVVPRALLVRASAGPDEAVVVALDAACQARLLDEHGPEGYQFAHDVIREVVEQDLGAARRAALHRRVAEALEHAPGDAPLDRLAYHYAQAALRDKAAVYLERAGDRARTRYANSAADAHYGEAVAALAPLGRPLDVARIQEKWGAVVRMMGRFEAALAVFEQAIAAYEAAGDLESVARVLGETWLLYLERGASGEGVQRYQAVIDRLAPRGPSAGLAALYVALGMMLVTSERYAELLLVGDRAVALAQGVEDPEVRAEAEVRRGNALIYMVGRVEEGIRSYEKAIRLGEAAGGLYNLTGFYNVLSTVYLARGEVATSRQLNARGQEIAARQGNLHRLLVNVIGRAAIAFRTGDWEQAYTDFAWARETSRQIAVPRPYLDALVGLGGLLLARGEWEAAAVHLDEAVALASRRNDRGGLRAASLLLAERDLLAGQPEAACARLLPLRALSDPQERYIDDLRVWLAWARAEVGALDEARSLIVAALACIRADNRRLVLADALRVQALVAIKQEHWTEAESTLAEGLAVARAIGYPYAEARLLCVQGLAHRQQGRPEEAGVPFQAALAIFGRLGARMEAGLVERALGGLQPASARALGERSPSDGLDRVVPSQNEGRGRIETVVSDAQWALVQALLPPPARTGRRRADDRRTLEAILYQRRTGCGWAALPAAYGDEATAHRRLRQWHAAGLWERIVEIVQPAPRSG